jgi:hypothetical protein
MDSRKKILTGGTSTDYIISTSDFYGNVVGLSKDTWETHITPFHKEMTGHIVPVKITIQKPSLIMRSRNFGNRLIFQASNLLLPRQNIVRVVVEYDDIALALTGNSAGDVVTAFAPSADKEFQGNLGEIIYQKPRPTKKKKKR